MAAQGSVGRKVLIVEDDAGTSQTLKRLLEHYGCEVEAAATVTEAMEMVKGEPEFVFLDLKLPDGDGVSVLEHVRHRNLATRVIIVTGESEPARLRRARSLMPEAMLSKPVDFMRILELMRPAA